MSKPEKKDTTAQSKPTTDKDHASMEKAEAELHEKLANMFNFFKKVPSDISSSTSKLSQVIKEKDSAGFMEIVKKKAKEVKEAVKATLEEVHEEKPEPSKKEEDKNGSSTDRKKQEGKNKSVTDSKPNTHRDEKETDKAKEAKKVEVEEKPKGPRFKNLQEALSSIGDFVSKTAACIQESSSKAVARIHEGGLLEKKSKESPKQVKKGGEAPKEAMDAATKKRLEEVKKMKQSFEQQLKSLDKEIAALEQIEKAGMSTTEDGTNPSRQNVDKQQKKAFRISQGNSKKPLKQEGSEKREPPVRSPKPVKRTLPPLEEGQAQQNQTQSQQQEKRWDAAKALKTVNSQPLYLKMEKEFIQNVVFPELEARKEKLKAKKEFYKPIEDKELREHAIKYEEKKKTLVGIHVEKPPLRDESVEKILKLPKSLAFKKMIEHDKEEKVKAEQKDVERKLLKDKQQQYAKLVKEMYLPKLPPKEDPLSKENLQNLIEQSKKVEEQDIGGTGKPGKEPKMNGRLPPRKNRGSEEIAYKTHQPITYKYSPGRDTSPMDKNAVSQRVKVKGSYATPQPHAQTQTQLGENGSTGEMLKEHVLDMEGLNREENSSEAREDSEGTMKQTQTQAKKMENKGKLRMTSVSPPRRVEKKKSGDAAEEQEKKEKEKEAEAEVKKVSYPNYLDEVRKKRIEQEKKTGKAKYDGQWEKILKKKEMSQQEKVLAVLETVNKLESQAKMKETRLKRRGEDVEPVDLEDEVGEMYLASIKAKLAIIKDLA